MPAPTLQGTQQFIIPGSTTNPTFIQVLAGAGNLYISNNPGVSPTQFDYVLGSSGTITRGPGIASYVCTDVDDNVTISYGQDGSSVNPGTVALVGPVNANITGPVDVTGSDVGVTGPVTVEGAVGVSGNVGVAGTVNAQSINLPTLIYNHSQVIGAAVGTTQINAGTIDVSAYASVIIAVSSTAVAAAVDTRNYFDISATELDSAFGAGSPLGVDYEAQWLIDTTGAVLGPPSFNAAMYFQIPVRQNTLSVILSIIKGVTVTGGSFTAGLTMYGSNEVIIDPIYVNESASMIPAGPQGLPVVFTASESNYIATKNGTAYIYTLASTSTSVSVETLSYASDGKTIAFARVTQTGANLSSITPLTLPYRPILFAHLLSAGTSQGAVSQ